MDTDVPPVVPPASILFARGVIARLDIWSILRIAVQENWGGPNAAAKRRWLASAIVDAFEEQSSTPDDHYIEELLLQVMVDEFETIVEDGSSEPVALDIVRLYDQTRLGKDDLVLEFEKIADRFKGKKLDVEIKVGSDDEGDWEDDDGEDEDEENEDEAPQLQPVTAKPREPEIDEDGFTLVTSKKRR